MTQMRERKLRVLWATDGSQSAKSAIPILRQLVLPATDRLLVLNVAPHSVISGARPDPAFLAGVAPGARRRALLEAQQLAEREATLLNPSVPVQAVSRWGNPIEEVLRTARTISADIIVMGAKGHSNLALLFLGSVAQGVVQHSTRPVLVARPGTESVAHVMVGYDGSPPARRALTFLDRLAIDTRVRITLLSIIEPFAAPAGTPIGYRKQALEEAHRINEQNQRLAERRLERIASRLEMAGRKVKTEVIHGIPGLEIDALARKEDADLIVVGSRRPSPAEHYLLASTAEKLVRHSHTSVLVVR